jgi:hypothetical protein
MVQIGISYLFTQIHLVYNNLNKIKMGVIIQPVSISANGQSKEASELDARIIYDDLATSCTFYYELKEVVEGVSGSALSVGNVAMDGQDYIDWDNSNSAAYVYIAGKLNLVII